MCWLGKEVLRGGWEQEGDGELRSLGGEGGAGRGFQREAAARPCRGVEPMGSNGGGSRVLGYARFRADQICVGLDSLHKMGRILSAPVESLKTSDPKKKSVAMHYTTLQWSIVYY